MSADSKPGLIPIKSYKKLLSRKGRIESGTFAVEGERAIRQIIQSQPESVIEILANEKESAVFDDYPIRILTEKQFNSISQMETPRGIMAVMSLPADTYSEVLPRETGNRVLLLENIQDPGNVGTLIRTAAAFDFNGVILSGKCADPFSPKCVQSSAGTVLSIWIRRNNAHLELAQQLRKSGLALAVADVHGIEDPSLLGSVGKIMIALGNEAAGPSKELLQFADHRLRIPISKEKAESLNVAACGAICMYLSSLGDS